MWSGRKLDDRAVRLPWRGSLDYARRLSHGRNLSAGSSRERRVAEVVAPCWMWFCRLAKRGKDATTVSTMLASFASRQVKSGQFQTVPVSPGPTTAWLRDRAAW